MPTQEEADAAEAKKYREGVVDAADDGNLAAVRHFLRTEPKCVEVKDIVGFTALHRAAENGHLPVAQLLVESRADLEAKNNFGSTALHKAAVRGHLPVAQLLVKSRADLEAKNNFGGTALHGAAANNKLPVAQLLVESRADLEAKNHGGETPADRAQEEDHQEIVAFLKAARQGGASPSKGYAPQATPAQVSPSAAAALHGGHGSEPKDQAAPATKLKRGEGARVGMFSARFDGGETERRFRAVHKILLDHGYDVLMVSVGPGQSFGDLTARYLRRVRKEGGTMLAVCTKHYGEMTASNFSSHEEVKYAKTWGLDVFPLKVEDTYPPEPPYGGKGHLDQEGVGQDYIDMVFTPDKLYYDCRGKTDLEIAEAIAARLHQR